MFSKGLIIAFAASLILLSGCIEHQGDSMAQKALASKDPSLCLKNLTQEKDKTECLVVYSTGIKDPKPCLAGPVPEDCLTEYAIKNRQMTPCDLLTDPAKKYTCVAKFTGDSTGRSLEIIIADWKTNGRVSSCIKQCEATAVRCREGCIGTKSEEYKACGGFADPGYDRCAGDIEYKYKNCMSDCDQKQWYECEPPCKEIGN